MKRIILAILLALSASIAYADSFDDGYVAYKRGDYATAYRLWKPLAEQGHVSAQFNLGLIYDNGHGVPQDHVEAASWYREAAEQGNTKAQYNLGLKYVKGHGVPQDYAEAESWWRKAAKQGLASAQSDLGIMYDNGYGVPQDYVEAIRWYRKAAKQGFASAQLRLGFMYANGQGVPQDNSEAIRWYLKAAEKGDAQAQKSLGIMYTNGSGVPQDYAEAVRWYRKAAEQGLASAQTSLGFKYYEGKGVPQDYAEAIRWYRKAAKQGNPLAQFNLGFLYLYGLGVPKDSAEAHKWLDLAAKGGIEEAREWRDRIANEMSVAQTKEKNKPLQDLPPKKSVGNSNGSANADAFEEGDEAYDRGDYKTAFRLWRPLAEQGDDVAQYNLGLMYEEGQGVQRDYAEAARWYRKAAEQGDADAQYNLGLMYQRGQGVLLNYTQAVMWYRKAAEQGLAESQLNLGVMYAEGTGVQKNFAEAHKWFDLAAKGGNVEAREWRDRIANEMSVAQTTETKNPVRDLPPKKSVGLRQLIDEYGKKNVYKVVKKRTSNKVWVYKDGDLERRSSPNLDFTNIETLKMDLRYMGVSVEEFVSLVRKQVETDKNYKAQVEREQKHAEIIREEDKKRREYAKRQEEKARQKERERIIGKSNRQYRNKSHRQNSECEKAEERYRIATAKYDSMPSSQKTPEITFLYMSIAHDADVKCGY